MAHLENNHEEWEKIRARADSLANAVFLIAGGVLSVSISVMISANEEVKIPQAASSLASQSWYWLLASIVLLLTLKTHMIFQAFLLHVKTEIADKHNAFLNSIGWFLGLSGLVSFIVGFIQMIRAASIVVGS